MADGVDRKQLREELNSALSRDGQGSSGIASDDPPKRPIATAKKKRSKPKKRKDNAITLTEGEPRCEEVPSPAELASHTAAGSRDSRVNQSTVSGAPASSAISTPKPGQQTQAGANAKSSSAKKKDKSLVPPSPASAEKTDSGNVSKKSDVNTQPDKKQQAPPCPQDSTAPDAGRGKAKESGQGDSNTNEKRAKTKPGQNEASAKQKPVKDKTVEGSAASTEAKPNGQKQGKMPGNAQGDGHREAKGPGAGNNTNNNKPRPSRLGEEQLTEEMMNNLADNKMHLLKKPNPKFRNARYFCRLCDFHLDQMEDCLKHMKDNRHCRRKEISEVDAILRLIPAATEDQLGALTTAVDGVWEARAIDVEQQATRRQIVTRLESFLQQHIPDVLLYMYGSSLTGFGLKEADINTDLSSSDKDRKLTFLLKDVHSIMKDRTDTGFSDVRADFSAKVPILLLTDVASGLTVSMAIHCYSAHCSSELLAIYSDMDPRVRKLVVAFRYWAHLCGLDRQTDGFIPPQALNIMVIYFLQALSPQLIPIICPPKVSGEDVGDFRQDEPSFNKMRTKAMKSAKETRNQMSVGELWLRLLRFYCLEFDTPGVVVSIRSSQAVPRNTKPWNCKKLAVEDPYMLKKNITRMVNNSRIYEYWQDSIRKAYYYFGLPRDSEGKSLVSEADLKAKSLLSEKPADAGASSASSSLSQKSQTNDRTDKKKEKPKSEDEKALKNRDSKADTAADGEEDTVSIAPNPLLAGKSPGVKDKGKTPGNRDCTGSVTEPGSEKSSTLGSEESRGLGDSKEDKNCALSRIDAGFQLVDSGYSDEHSRSRKATTPSASRLASLPACEETGDSGHSPSSSFPTPSVETPCGDTCSTEPGEADSVRQFARDYASDIIAKAVSSVTSLASESDGDTNTTAAAAIAPQRGTSEKEALTKLERVGAAVPPSPIVAEPDCSLIGQHQTTVDSSTEGSLMEKVEHPLTPTDVTEGGSCDPPRDPSQLSAEELDPGDLSEESCLYDFDKNYFTDGKGPTLVCTYCEKEGHLKNACPEDELPEVLNLPEMTEHHLKVLTETLNLVPSEVGLSDASIKNRWRFLEALQDFIQYQFDDAILTLFGSTCNGFGFDKSDMDICMTFTRRTGKIDKVHVIETLARRLKNYSELSNVQAISTAKVPIVKFTIRHNQLEGDISLYNTLAQQNTKLLYCYSKIDPRVRILGYAIKTFAKVCDIGDASRGSLSSYAYILMMLYYLQQVQPPVIPVLQELYKGSKRPELIIEECDAWFMDDLSKLEEFWPEKGQNKMSVAELWLGFLRFYVEEFNYKEFVVSIRQKALLTRFEKLWNGTCVAVEDPFDLSHNLGSGLTRKMNNFIFKTFINGRMLYGSPIDHNMDIFNTYQCPSDYFFDTELLSENRPPNVRGCRRCGKIGHLQRACPLNRKDREEEEQKHRQQRQQQQQQQQQHQQQQMGPGRPHDRGYATPRQNHPQQHYRDRDMRERYHDSDMGSGNSSSNTSRHHGGPSSGSGGNTNRNSSATSAGHGSRYGYNRSGGPPLMDRPAEHQQPHQHPQHQRMGGQHHTAHTYHNSNFRQQQQQQHQHQYQNQHHQPQHHQNLPPHHHHHHHPQQQQQQQHQHQQQQQQFYRQQQHQQQQLRHQQQEQQRQAAMMAAASHSNNNNRGTPLPPPPIGFDMQPVMASTPRTNMNLPPQQQQQQQQRPPHVGYGGMRQQHPPLHHQQQQQGGGGGGGGGYTKAGMMRPSPQQHPGGSGGGAGGAGGGGGRPGNNNQPLNPVVQSLFSQARGQVMDMNSGQMSGKYH